MQSLLSRVLGWVLRNAALFGGILLILVLGSWALQKYSDYRALPQQASSIGDLEANIDKIRDEVASQSVARASSIRATSAEAIDAEVKRIDNELQRKSSELKQINLLGVAVQKAPVADQVLRWARLKMEIECLGQEREFLVQAGNVVAAYPDLSVLRSTVSILTTGLADNDKSLAAAAASRSSGIWLTPAYRRLKELETRRDALTGALEIAKSDLKNAERQTELLANKRRPFAISMHHVEDSLHEVRQVLRQTRLELEGNPLRALSVDAKQQVPTALLLLFAAVLTPLGIKGAFYWVLAPLAERYAPISLLPDTSGECFVGDVGAQGNGPAVRSGPSCEVDIGPQTELLVHPQYIQSSSMHGRRDTKWILDWRYPLMSILSGLVVLTRVRSDSPQREVISAAAEDPLTNVQKVKLPAGSAMVLQPRCIVGVVAARASPLKITSVWRFFSLHAWLTLQLRYLVFHGPAVLIIKGCRGVRFERAGDGRRINQAATLGFSANLQYATTRSEPFMSYLSAKQDLFEDRFAGSSGVYVFEEVPSRSQRSGVTGRSLESFVDAALKVVGM